MFAGPEPSRARVTGFCGTYDGNIYNRTLNRQVNGYRHYGGRALVPVRHRPGAEGLCHCRFHNNNDSCCAEIIATPLATGSLVASVLPTPEYAPPPRGHAEPDDRHQGRWLGVSAQADAAVGLHTLTSITAYRGGTTEIRDGDWLDKACVGFQRTARQRPAALHHLHPGTASLPSADQKLSYVLGAYYSRALSRDLRGSLPTNDIACTAAVGAPTGRADPPAAAPMPMPRPRLRVRLASARRFKNTALFGRATHHATDRVRVIAGLRYSHDQLDVFLKRVTTPVGRGIQPSFDQGVFSAL